jgi:replicative DNA helicase
VLGAGSGHGKTTIALQFALHAAYEDPDSCVLFISPEMSHEAIEEMDFISDVGHSRYELARDVDILGKMAAWIETPYAYDLAPYNFYVCQLPTVDVGGLDELEGQIGMLATTLPVSLIVLDYAQYVLSEIDNGKRQRFALASDIIRSCNRMAESWQCAVLLTSQINATYDKGKLTSVSLRESALFEHSAAAVLYFVREFDDNGEDKGAYFRIGKNRYGSLGKIEVETRAGCYAVRDKVVI